jgi:heat shock protein HtpX
VTADNLFAQQAANRRSSTLLVAGFIVFFSWIGFGGDLGFYLLTEQAGPGAYRHTVPFIGIVETLVAGGIGWFSWHHGSKRVLWSSGAWELITPVTFDQRQLINVVEEMSIASGLPKPTVWIVPDPDPNAFATGIDPNDAHIAVTEGLLRVLDRAELQGVVAHEMAHVRNFDVRLMTLLAAMVGVIALMSDGFGRLLQVRGGRMPRVGRGGGARRDGNPLAILVLVAWVLTLIIAPIVSRLIAMTVSRKREFLADATGAQLTRNPAALASALEKLDSAAAATVSIRRGAAHLCIVDPAERRIASREGFVGDVFASHPPIRQRITRLKGMSYQLGKQAGGLSRPISPDRPSG